MVTRQELRWGNEKMKQSRIWEGARWGAEEDERSWGLATEAPGPSPAGVKLGFVPGPGSVLGVPTQDSSWVGSPRLGGTPLLPSPGASQPLGPW